MILNHGWRRMEIIYEGKGIYRVGSRSIKGKFHTVIPKHLYCTCPAIKIECEHIKQTMARITDSLLGITPEDFTIRRMS